MGRAKGDDDRASVQRRDDAQQRLTSKDISAAMPPAVARTLRRIAPLLSSELYLAGGTGAALYLHHRRSQDLDFFYHAQAVDLDELERRLIELGAEVELRSPGTLRVYLGETKVEFLHADEVRPQHRLSAPNLVAGVSVASPQDLMAMKLKVLAERGELRDYYDAKQMDEQGEVSLEDGVAYFAERYGYTAADGPVHTLIRSLGYLDDCEEDEAVPLSRAELSAWWRRRQAQLVRNLGR